MTAWRYGPEPTWVLVRITDWSRATEATLERLPSGARAALVHDGTTLLVEEAPGVFATFDLDLGVRLQTLR